MCMTKFITSVCVLQESAVSCSASVPACDEAPAHHSLTSQLKVKGETTAGVYGHLS